jgi:hypothetical protein
MKTFVFGLAALALTSCCSPGKVGPKPDIRPAIVSNAATRKSIKEVRQHTKQAQVDIHETGRNLDDAEKDLQGLLK